MNISVEYDVKESCKKVAIRATPTMGLVSIVEEACLKLGLSDPNSYGLIYKKTPLDLSLSVRLANINSGTKLSLVFKGKRSISNIQLAIQLDDGNRLIDNFPSNTSLWDILLHFESSQLNLTRRMDTVPKTMFEFHDKPVYLMPICIFMNKEYKTQQVLQSTTLEHIGLLSGNGVIRLLFNQVPGNWNEFVKVDDSQNSVQKPKPSKTVVEPVKTTASIDSKPINFESPMPTNTVVQNQRLKDTVIVDPDIHYYEPPLVDSPARKIDLPDSFFKLTTTELKLMMSMYKTNSQALDSKPLMTQKMREEEEAAKNAKYPKTLIRVRFPDRTTLQASFWSGEKVQALFDVVGSVVKTEEPFRLYTTPPMKDLDPNMNFWKQSLAPATLVYFSTLKAWSVSIEKEPWPTPTITTKDETQHQETEQKDNVESEPLESKSETKKLPKWLQFGKK